MSKDSERFQVWLDGGMVAPEDAKVSVLTAVLPVWCVPSRAKSLHASRKTGPEKKNRIVAHGWRISSSLNNRLSATQFQRDVPPPFLQFSPYGRAEANSKGQETRIKNHSST